MGFLQSDERNRKSAMRGILFCSYAVNLFLNPIFFGNNSSLLNPCESKVMAVSIEIFPKKSGLYDLVAGHYPHD